MKLLPANVFVRHHLERQFNEVFDKIAATITGEYIQRHYEHVNRHGISLSFMELMDQVKLLTNELTLQAEWIRENYKEGRGYRSTSLTAHCKRTIKKSVAEFMAKSKPLVAIGKRKEAAM